MQGNSPVDEGFMTKNTITRDVAIQKIFFRTEARLQNLQRIKKQVKPTNRPTNRLRRKKLGILINAPKF